jgi:hypothetical protein
VEGDLGDLRGHGEHDVEVGHRQQLVNDQKPVARLVGRERQKIDLRAFLLFRVWDSLPAWQPRRAFPIWSPVPQMSCGRC